MRIDTLRREQWISQPLDVVFAFFADPFNLERLTPPWLRFRIVGEPPEMRTGALIDYQLRLRGLPIRWQSRITAWDPSTRFVDEQTRGPYRLWIHEHLFQPSKGGTLVTDHIRYSVRGGRLIRSLLVEPDLRKIFDYRRDQMKEIWKA